MAFVAASFKYAMASALQTAADRMMSELFDMVARAVGVETFDGSDDTPVQLAPALAQQARVANLMRQGMLERVAQFREKRRPVEEPGRLQPDERGTQRALRHAGDGLQELE
jgi:hypothetical protein